MSERELLYLVTKLEEFEGYLSTVKFPDPSIQMLILKLRQDILGLMPFVDVHRIVMTEEGEE